MQHDHVGQIYELLDEAAQVIAEAFRFLILRGLRKREKCIFLKSDQLPLQEKQTGELNSLLAKADFRKWEHEWIRKAFQLAILKGLKDKSHPNRQMTPDTIFFISYLVNKFTGKYLTLLDPPAAPEIFC